MDLDLFDEYTDEKCQDCEKAKDSVTLTNCPYAEEIRGELVPMLLCKDCYKERCMEI